MGNPITLLLRDRAHRCLEQDREIFHGGEPTPGFEEEIAGYDGAKRTFATVKTPLRDASQNIVGVVTISTDITARKAAEERLT